MTYHTIAFSTQSIASVTQAINTYLAANPTFVPISITNTVDGANFYCVLLYSV